MHMQVEEIRDFEIKKVVICKSVPSFSYSSSVVISTTTAGNILIPIKGIKIYYPIY
jgi:hypothetical protein